MHLSDRSPLLNSDPFVRTSVRPLLQLQIVKSAAVCLLVLASSQWLAANAYGTSVERPEFAVISQAVTKFFDSLPDHQPADLISQTHVKLALGAVAVAGWEVPDGDALVNRALADSSFLIRTLATPAGQKFMRDLERYPGAYSRLDRLSTISNGEHIVRDLVHRPGGYELIEYMTTTQGGRNLGSMMAGVEHGVDLNKPTGRIYTVADLIAALKELYDESAP